MKIIFKKQNSLPFFHLYSQVIISEIIGKNKYAIYLEMFIKEEMLQIPGSQLIAILKLH